MDKRAVRCVFAFVAVLGLIFIAAPGAAGRSTAETSCVLTAQLRSTDLDAKGHVQFKVSGTELSYRLFINNKGGHTFGAAHIHGPRPSSAIFIGLFNGFSLNDDKIRLEGQLTITAAQAEQLCSNTEAFYFNVHLASNLARVITGDLR